MTVRLNGVAWAAVPAAAAGEDDGQPVLGGPGEQSMTGLAAAVTDDGLRIVAVGRDGDEARAWWSRDGIRWFRQAMLDDGDSPTAVVALTDRFLAVGTSGAVWYLKH